MNLCILSNVARDHHMGEVLNDCSLKEEINHTTPYQMKCSPKGEINYLKFSKWLFSERWNKS